MKMPKKVLIYVCDYHSDGTPLLAVAVNLNDIPEDSNGEPVGEYELITKSRLCVQRTLEPSR